MSAGCEEVVDDITRQISAAEDDQRGPPRDYIARIMSRFELRSRTAILSRPCELLSTYKKMREPNLNSSPFSPSTLSQ